METPAKYLGNVHYSLGTVQSAGHAAVDSMRLAAKELEREGFTADSLRRNADRLESALVEADANSKRHAVA